MVYWKKRGDFMKRLVILAALAAAFWSVPIFGAENIQILRDGEEVRLSSDIVRQDGTLMLPLRDIAELTQSELRQEDGVTALGYRMEGGSVVLEYEQTATLVGDTLYDRRNRRIPLAGKALRQDGRIFLPVRMAAEALGYTVKWNKADGVETLSLERPVMPKITLDVAYDRVGQKVSGVIRNREPQSFTYGYEFMLERRTEAGWERVREAEWKDIDDIGLYMEGRVEGLSDGETAYQTMLSCLLPAGHYRIGVPFHFEYYVDMPKKEADSFWERALEKYREDASEENIWRLCFGLSYYYSTKWGEPGFFFEGADMEPEKETEQKAEQEWEHLENRINTAYVLYGEFDVE